MKKEKLQLFQLFSNELKEDGIFKIQIYQDVHVKKIWISPFSIISATNETQNKILFSYEDKRVYTAGEIRKYLDIAPDKRFKDVDFILKKGDIIKLKVINTLRGYNTIKVLFLIEKIKNGHHKVHKRGFKTVRN